MIEGDFYGAVDVYTSSLKDGVLTGIASSKTKGRCCKLALRSSGVLIQVVTATRYHESVEAKAFNYGWCGYRVNGLGKAFALSDDVSLTDESSGLVLEVVSASSYINSVGNGCIVEKSLSTKDIRLKSVEDVAAPDLDSILSFALDYYQSHGGQMFVDAAYKTILGRPADGSSPHDVPGSGNLLNRIREYLTGLFESEEYKSSKFLCIPGPFHPGFQFR